MLGPSAVVCLRLFARYLSVSVWRFCRCSAWSCAEHSPIRNCRVRAAGENLRAQNKRRNKNTGSSGSDL